MANFYNCLGKQAPSIPDALLRLQRTEDRYKDKQRSIATKIQELVSRYDCVI